PGTRYDFRIDSASQIYSFQTMPSDIDRTPVVFAIGGDTFEGRSKVRRERIDRLQRILSQYHPSFILWSQPLPHHSRTFEHSTEWDDWLDAIKEALIDENGHITPIISAVDHFHPETLTSHEDQPGISTSPIHTAFQS